MSDDIKEQLLRGWGILNPNNLADRKITLIGAGGIGSHFGIMLARMGIPFRVFDEDIVEVHNLSNQLYPSESLGKNKALMLQQECARFGLEIEANPVHYTGQQLSEIVISGLDSQEVRRTVFRDIRRQKVPFYIDGRMGGEELQIFALNPTVAWQVKKYNERLQGAAEPTLCTERAIAYNLFGVAGWMGKMLQHYVKTGRHLANYVYCDYRNGAFVADEWKQPKEED